MSFKYETCTKAAEAGDLEELERLHLSGCPWDIWTPALAALNGHLECLKYVHENGCRWNVSTCDYAARNGYLECLKYAHENGCPWDGHTASFAAENGYLDCLKYAHENGCRWNVWTPILAVGHLECLKYCFERWNEPQEFWNFDFDLSKIIDKIDLDDPVWRRLFTLDLSKYPELQSKVNAKKQEIEKMKEASQKVLQNTLPVDIIKYCIHPFF